MEPRGDRMTVPAVNWIVFGRFGRPVQKRTESRIWSTTSYSLRIGSDSFCNRVSCTGMKKTISMPRLYKFFLAAVQ